MPFTGRGFWAYDNGAEHFVSTWIDSMSTGLALWTGTREGDVLTLAGGYQGPAGTVETRHVIALNGADAFTLTEHRQTPQGEVKTTVLTYTRVGVEAGSD